MCDGGGIGPHLWCVYLFLYAEHPMFCRIDQFGGSSQEIFEDLSLHGGCTLFRVNMFGPERSRHGKSGVASIEIGCDYAHLYDDHHTHSADNRTVFADAQNLLEFASNVWGCGDTTKEAANG
jgi:hypothetical protein